MRIDLPRLEEDDPGFLDVARAILAGCLHHYESRELFLVRIRDWFDSKWCYFSGKVVGALERHDFRNLPIPPFIPNRVLSQAHFTRRDAITAHYDLTEATPLHIHQHSDENRNRFTRKTMPNGTMMWVSGGSKTSGRGSIMVYCVFSEEIKFGWHVTFIKKAAWQIDKITLTSRALVEGLRETGERILADREAMAEAGSGKNMDD